ncbi:tRNA 5-methoxyuridine(34)/uridine 5-oxyacetic acid(34) synthase CmoB [uncultured Campylobacter sp.]|uniref:tRNA 5-methoxyuridine(34)/uridine 5-oxyacetic acid(34) synthase CmoB n=1 Tax=uncultured Campylobacter sp. TaxID=218934 RepID=UPI0025D72FDD|nr:tRNA 5-methoxyuridine(34)/uridine 5-oxyacetic acid(34) synthase CmoB [uncultured Campylobacter sp.]
MDLRGVRARKIAEISSGANGEILRAIENLPQIACECDFSDVVSLKFKNLTPEQAERIKEIALALKPWRKGPFRLGELFIDAEWRSFVKFNLLAPHLNLDGKTVADVGCNNGYYMFRMLPLSPRKIVGLDPSARTFLQFKFIDRFAKSNAIYEPLGVEHLPFYEHKFDAIFCLGVIYHRSDPVKTLKELKSALNPGGEVFLDTMYIDIQGDFTLTPRSTYSKISNIYFVPTISALQNWCERAKFKDFEILATKDTDADEQRKTEWIDGQSLGDFLDPKDPMRTIEGYPAPKRVYVKIKI